MAGESESVCVIETQVRQSVVASSQSDGGRWERRGGGNRDGAINCVMSVIPCKES